MLESSQLSVTLPPVSTNSDFAPGSGSSADTLDHWILLPARPAVGITKDDLSSHKSSPRTASSS